MRAAFSTEEHTMPTDPNRFPAYCRFWPKQRKEQKLPPLAYVRIRGRVHYLGEYDSPGSHNEYARLRVEHEKKCLPTAAGRRLLLLAGGGGRRT